jgi:hypothetical protein
MYINNNTPFEFIALPNYDKEGREVFTNIIKGTFFFTKAGPLAVAKEQVPIAMADEYWGEPGISPMKYEADLAVFKPSTDLVLLGFAYHSRGKKISAMDVAFGVGAKTKRATVQSSEASDRIALMLLDRFGEKKGVFASGLLGNGFGFYPKQYPPRAKFAGTYDERWRKERFPFLPIDFDYRFFQSAYPELVTDGYLRGNERIFAENVSPDGPISINLPGINIEVETIFEKKSVKARANLDTVVLEPEGKRLLLIWRQMVPCHNLIGSIQGFEIQTSRDSKL